jgi:hypothetical protein
LKLLEAHTKTCPEGEIVAVGKGLKVIFTVSVKVAKSNVAETL